ncbi:hypothetical protein ACFZDK_40120 [Streptomyces sp. NPDC007901]|uniref:hypothetical protein n=1 Tax=Streptomyces sp. NPDC007901 TaxID=3364785 RepID=UPI0036E6273F
MTAYPGVGWVWKNNQWQAVDAVTFTETDLDIQSVVLLRDHRGGGTGYAATFPSAGNYLITALAVESNGTQLQAPSRTISVAAAIPPAFTWVTPADGSAVSLGPGGGSVGVQLATGSDQFYPWTVSIAHDGQPATSEQYTGTQYNKTIALGPTPLGSRSLTVTCTDPNGLATTQTRSLVGQDSAPPAVTIGAFAGTQTARSLPYTVTLTGTTTGTSSGVTKVAYAFTGGPTGTAQDTSSGGDWSTWRVQAPLNAIGSYPFTITATDSRGTTRSASGTVTLAAQAPPVFTWVAPADGSAVGLGPGGGSVGVQLATGSDQFYPWTVSIAHDGQPATSEQYTGTQYNKTIALGPTPLGSRSLTVTCTDPNGLATTQTRSLVGQDSAPPAVTINDFDKSQTATSLPYTVTLAGTTSGASSGVTQVAYAFTGGPTGSAQDTSPGSDWSSWQVQAPLNTTGSYPFTVTATDSRGTTASASGTITLHL